MEENIYQAAIEVLDKPITSEEAYKLLYWNDKNLTQPNIESILEDL